MRKVLNDNPVAQVAILGGLALVVGFFLLTRMHSSSGGSSTTPDVTSPASGAVATPSSTATPGTAVAPTAPSVSSAPVPSGNLVAGPGLPKPLAKAYADGKAAVLLVVRNNGIDDSAVQRSVDALHRFPRLAVFVTRAGHIARFSRIAEGVNVDRTPALIVIRPKSLTNGPPTATISYGFRSPASVAQAVRNTVYKGPTNLPYYPR